MKLPRKSRPILSESQAFEKLHALGQEHLLENWNSLTPEQKQKLVLQITQLEPSLIQRCQQFLSAPSHLNTSTTHAPFEPVYVADDRQNQERGIELVKEGKCALLILAGGQGSRLRYEGPKGCFPVTKLQKKSLFQLTSEKIKAAGRRAQRPLEIALMTSPLNYVETQTFFAAHAFFGLHSEQVTFFYQRMWPFLNFQKNLFLETPDHIAQGPNGNGGVFRRLIEIGLWDKWKSLGIEMVQVIPIDNPLATPFNAELLGFHAQNQADVSLVVAPKRSANQSVGVLANVNGKAAILEYSELSDEEKEAKDQTGELKYRMGNVGIYCFSMSFLQQAGQFELPLHLAKKAVKEMGPNGETVFPNEPNAWKFEEFIFDVLPFAERVQALLVPSGETYAPLKNLKGEDSIEAVTSALLAYDQKIFTEVTGNAPPSGTQFELDPQFYYPTAELLAKWKGRPFPNEDYIHE
jgi:UDP-N-acetylglucosamine/UDP-N-acetylgalactosamine diphosphorylase